MALATAPAHAEHAHGAHSRLPINRLGIWLFFFSDALLFAMLAAARFYLTGTERPEELNQLLGLGITSVLLLSSLTAYRAETAFEHGNVGHGRAMLLATLQAPMQKLLQQLQAPSQNLVYAIEARRKQQAGE